MWTSRRTNTAFARAIPLTASACLLITDTSPGTVSVLLSGTGIGSVQKCLGLKKTPRGRRDLFRSTVERPLFPPLGPLVRQCEASCLKGFNGHVGVYV